MLNKLAIKNAYRSIKDYAIYLITVTLSFSFLFAFNLIGYSEDVLNLSSTMVNFKYSMYVVNSIIIFVICFLINYTTKFIFKKRSKELGTYMMLGIKKKKITSLITKENLLLGFTSLFLAIPLGYLFSIVMSYIMMNIFELPKLIKISFTTDAFIITFLYFFIIYIIVLFLLCRRFKKMKIHDLLYYERKNEKKNKDKSILSTIVFLISLALGIFALILFDKQFISIGKEPSMSQIFLCILALIISIYGIMITISGFALNFVLKHKKLKYKKENLFLVRMFSSKVRSMSFTLGTLSVLITLSLIALNISSLFKGMFEYQISQNAPYDISINLENMDELPKYINKIEEFYSIKEKFIHHTYYDSYNNIRNGILNDYYSWHQKDLVIKLSDYNKLMDLKNESRLNLQEDEFLINCSKEACEKIEESNIKEFKTKTGKSLKVKDITNEGFDRNIVGFSYFSVLPDQYVEELMANTILTVNTKEKTSELFADQLISINSKDNCHQENNMYICYSMSNIVVKGKEEVTNKSFMTITSFICFYIALIFTAVVGTILAIQSLSESCEYKYRYTVLKRLGYNNTDCYKLIRKQLLYFFIFPVMIPIIVSFSSLKSMNNLFQIALTTSNEYLSYFMINLFFFLSIYILYLIATYFGYKKNIEE